MSETQCRVCGAEQGQPHHPIESDCALPHRYDRADHPPQARRGHACTGCVKRLREHVTEIGKLHAELATVIPLGSVPDDTAAHKHTKRTGSPAQMRLDAWALAQNAVNAKIRNPDNPAELIDAYLGAHLPDVPATMTAWAQAVYDAHDWTDNAPDTVSGAVAVLIADGGIEAITAQADVDTFDAEVTWVRRALRNAHGITQPRPLGRCLSVDCRGQVWRTDDAAKCDRCGRVYAHLDLVRLRANEERAS